MKDKNLVIVITLLCFLTIGLGVFAFYVMTKNTENKDNNKIEEKIKVEEKEEEHLEEKDEYCKVDLIEYSTGDMIEISKDYKVQLNIQDGLIYLDEKETNIQSINTKIYLADINNDNVMEIVTRAVEDMISPPTNYYHIYEKIGEEYKEVVVINIVGSIDYLYVKDKDIKVTYEPYESVPGTVLENHFTIND